MFYDSNKPFDIEKAKAKLNYLIEKKVIFEIKEKRKRRTINQNSYMHLLFDWFAAETGYTAEEVKQDIFKKIVNPSIFYEGEFGELVKIERWRSTVDLDTKELTDCIDRFRNYSSAKAGIYLPEPSDLALIEEMEIQINNNQKYL